MISNKSNTIKRMTNKYFCLVTLGMTVGVAPRLAAQVATDVPPVVPGAKPMTVERIKVHGAAQPDVLANWAANAPLAFMDQYVGGLRQYRAIAIDVGDQDGLRIDAGKLHDALDKYGIANSFEVYSGTHTSRVADRFQNHVIPFFSQNLCSQAGCK